MDRFACGGSNPKSTPQQGFFPSQQTPPAAGAAAAGSDGVGGTSCALTPASAAAATPLPAATPGTAAKGALARALDLTPGLTGAAKKGERAVRAWFVACAVRLLVTAGPTRHLHGCEHHHHAVSAHRTPPQSRAWCWVCWRLAAARRRALLHAWRSASRSCTQTGARCAVDCARAAALALLLWRCCFGAACVHGRVGAGAGPGTTTEQLMHAPNALPAHAGSDLT
jgi:hypothetical protein